jgi:hypothetical protein
LLSKGATGLFFFKEPIAVVTKNQKQKKSESRNGAGGGVR